MDLYELHYDVPTPIVVLVGDSRHAMWPRTSTGRRIYRPLMVDGDTLLALRASAAGQYLLEARAC